MHERKKCIFRKIEKNLNSKGNKYFASDKNNKLKITIKRNKSSVVLRLCRGWLLSCFWTTQTEI